MTKVAIRFAPVKAGLVIASVLICFNHVAAVSAFNMGNNPSVMQENDSFSSKETTKNMTSADGIEYGIIFDESNLELYFQAMNIQDEIVTSGIGVEVDNQRVSDIQFTLRPGEKYEDKIGINDTIDAIESEHIVVVSTFGAYVNFTFKMDVIPSETNLIPTPYIQSVEIANGTIGGEPSAVARVTVANPSKQTYPTKLMVHTTGTDGSFYPAAVPPGETRTITVELLDERGSKIAGEARLFTGNLTTRDGAMDQVEFVGRAGEDTRHWNTSYRPVRPPWMSDSYRYRNRSVTGENGPFGGRTGTTLLYGVVAALVVLWLARRFR